MSVWVGWHCCKRPKKNFNNNSARREKVEAPKEKRNVHVKGAARNGKAQEKRIEDRGVGVSECPKRVKGIGGVWSGLRRMFRGCFRPGSVENEVVAVEHGSSSAEEAGLNLEEQALDSGAVIKEETAEGEVLDSENPVEVVRCMKKVGEMIGAPAMATLKQKGLRVTKFIDRGGMGSVVGATVERPDDCLSLLCCGDEVAVKVIHKTDETVLELREEIEVHKALLGHLSVPKLFGSFEDNENIYVVMERLRGRDVRDFVRRNGALKEHDALVVMRQVISFLDFAHSNGIAHQDIKPRNVMFSRNPVCDGKFEPDVRVIDFGLAVHGDRPADVLDEICYGICGTVGYAAPELSDTRPYSAAAADIWSAGVMFYGLLTRESPFCGSSFGPAAAQARRTWNKVMLRADVIENLCLETKELLKRMLSLNPVARITAREARSVIDGIIDNF